MSEPEIQTGGHARGAARPVLPGPLRSRLRLATARRRLAVVLSGGGTRGAYQAGVIDAMLRRGIRPSLLVGTSVGAVNGAWWAFHDGVADATGLHDVWLTATRDVLVPPPIELLRQVLRGGDHLAASARLAALLDRGIASGALLEEAAIPLTVTAVAAATGEPRRVTSGPLREAVLASAAVPGLFSTVMIDGERLADGGLAANCDVLGAALAGATDILAVDLMGGSGWAAGSDLWTVIERSLDVMLGRQTDYAVAALHGRARVAVLRAPSEPMPRFGDFKRTTSLFEAGRAAAEPWLDRVWDGSRVRTG